MTCGGGIGRRQGQVSRRIGCKTVSRFWAPFYDPLAVHSGLRNLESWMQSLAFTLAVSCTIFSMSWNTGFLGSILALILSLVSRGMCVCVYYFIEI